MILLTPRAPPPNPSQPGTGPPVPLCPEASSYVQKSTPVPATPVNMTASQRLILPDHVSPLPSVYDIDSGDEDEEWEGLGLPASHQAETHQQPPASPRLEPLQLAAGPPLLEPQHEPLNDQLRQLGQWSGAVPAGGATAVRPTTGHPGAVPAGGAAAGPPGLSAAASPLDDSLTQQLPDLTELAGPAFASLGDYLQFMCSSARVQSEMIMRLEDVGRRQNKLIFQLYDKVESLSAKLQPAGNTAATSQPPPKSAVHQPSPLQARPAPPQPSQVHPRAPPPQPPAALRPRHTPLYPVLPDTDREFETAAAQDPSSRQSDLTLLIGDSHVRTVQARRLEGKLSGGRLTVPAAQSPREGSAYTTTRQWPGAHFPDSNLAEQLPALLAKQPVKSVIVLTPSNNITNTEKLDSHEQSELAIQTALDTVATVEKALARSTGLEKAVIVELPPRADSWRLAELTEFSNFALRGAVEKSALSHKITLATLDTLYNHSNEKIFGHRNSRNYKYDGVHLRGKLGAKLYTESIMSAVRAAGLASSPVVRTTANPTPTHNRYDILSN